MPEIPSPKTRSRRRQALTVALSLGVSVAVLYAVARLEAISPELLAAVWEAADLRLLAATALFSLAFQLVVGADKLRRIVVALGAELPLREALGIRLGSGPLRFLLPARAGGLLNIVYLNRLKGMSVGRASGALVFDRAINLVGIVVWLLVALALMPGVLSTAGVVAAWVSLAAMLVVFLVPPLHRVVGAVAERVQPRLGGFVTELLAPFSEFSFPQRVGLLGYGVFFEIAPFTVCYLLFASFGEQAAWTQAMAFTSLANLVGHLPGPFVGIGPREAVVVALFSGTAAPETLLTIGVLMSLLVQAMPMVAGVPWLGWYFGRLGEERG